MHQELKKTFIALKTAVELAHSCEAEFVSSEHIVERFRGDLFWQGLVVTFELKGHPNAALSYAWSYYENGATKCAAVLHLPPIASPAIAVSLWLSAKRSMP